MPIEALDDAATITGWNADSRLAVALDFIQARGPLAMQAFEGYVLRRAAEEAEASAVDDAAATATDVDTPDEADIDAEVEIGNGVDAVLVGTSAYVTVDRASVYIRRTDEGVAVDIYPLDAEAIAACYAFNSELSEAADDAGTQAEG